MKSNNMKYTLEIIKEFTSKYTTGEEFYFEKGRIIHFPNKKLAYLTMQRVLVQGGDAKLYQTKKN